MIKLSKWQRFVLIVWGEVFIGLEIQNGWSKPNKIYAVNCSIHGLYSGPRHGWGNYKPQCPKCLEELTTKALLLNQKV